MDEEFPRRAATAPRRQASLRPIFGVALGAFLLGALGIWLLLRPDGFSMGEIFRVQGTAEIEQPGPSEPAPDAPANEPAPTAQEREGTERVDRVVEQQGGLDERIAAMEQRLTRLDLQAQAAAGNAARAEGLLIVFATRRAIERGAPLGYLADQLRLRFGDARPNAVETVINATRDPVTLDQLLARLDGLAPRLQDSPTDEGPIEWLGREIRGLFVVRREDAPSPAAERRLERARLFLESGRARAAASEVGNLPNAARAADWIADAERYANVQRALELLELTAILEPRELRDGDGSRVEQPAPAAAAAAPVTAP